MGIIVISNDQPVGKLPCYQLHVRCTEADVDRILDIVGDHSLSDAERSSISLAENRESLCVHGKRCPLSRLSIQELLDPLAIDELTARQSFVDPHGYN